MSQSAHKAGSARIRRMHVVTSGSAPVGVTRFVFTLYSSSPKEADDCRGASINPPRNFIMIAPTSPPYVSLFRASCHII